MVKDDEIYSTIELDPTSSTILNALNAHIAIINDEGTVVAFNKKWKSYSDELQESWSHPKLEDNILKSLQAPLASGSDSALRLLLGIKEVLNHEKESFEAELPVDSDGRQHWFRVTFNLFGFEEGGVLIYEDISHQTKSHQYLRETKEKLEKYFHNNLYGILVTDEDELVIEANAEACKILETNTQDISYSNIHHYLDVDFEVNEIQKKINREGNFLGEYMITTANGNEVPVELSVTLFREGNGKFVTSWAFKDISSKKITEQALKESELQYKLQFNNTLEGTIIGRPNGLMLTVNPAACDILGYEAEELEGKNRDLIFDMDNPINAAAVAKRRKNGEIRGEVEFTHKDGHRIPVEVSSVIFKAEDGTEKTIVNIKDISERKAIQQQLIQEKEFTESAISSLPTAFFVFKKSGEIVRWNTVLEKDFGYTADELAGMNGLDLVHPEDKQHVSYLLRRKFTNEQINFEIRCITKSGDTLHYIISGTGFIQDGEEYIVGSGLNQNDYKQVENEKNRKDELLSQLFDNSPIGIVLIDDDGTVQKSNKSFEKLFGYSNNELTGKNLDKRIVPDHLNEGTKTLSRLSFTGDSFQTEAIRVTKDGKQVPVLIGCVPVEMNGEVIAIYGLYVDISDRKELENQIIDLLETEQKARLHMVDMFEEAPSAIATLEGPNHTYAFVNDQYKKLVKRNNLVGKQVADVLPELAEQGFIELLDTCYNESKPLYFNERKVLLNDANKTNPEVHYLNFAFKPLFDNGEVYGIFIDAIDVTEQVEARNIIEESLAEKETLLNEVHHRVKNNLAIVSGLLELEMMGTTNEDVFKHLQSSQSRITTIAKIHELLYQNASLSHVDFSKFMKGVIGDGTKLPDSNAYQLIKKSRLDEVILNVNQAIPAGMLLNELMSDIAELNSTELNNQIEGLSFDMKDEGSWVNIDITDLSGNLFMPDLNSEQNLRVELIQVLLTQIHGELKTNKDKPTTLTIRFAKREVKGPHSGLDQ